MGELAEVLKQFNRKERHWLVCAALGSAANELQESFREEVEKAVRLRDPKFQIDPKAWWAIDYHFDWLVAALHILGHGYESARVAQLNKELPENKPLVQGNQQDIDLVIASGSTLVLIEAKGVGSWGGEGLGSKIRRLNAMTPDPISKDGLAGKVSVHFMLCSPEPAKKGDSFPSWALFNGKPITLNLKVAEPTGGFLKVERCDKDGHKDADGGHWHLVKDGRANRFALDSTETRVVSAAK